MERQVCIVLTLILKLDIQSDVTFRSKVPYLPRGCIDTNRSCPSQTRFSGYGLTERRIPLDVNRAIIVMTYYKNSLIFTPNESYLCVF